MKTNPSRPKYSSEANSKKAELKASYGRAIEVIAERLCEHDCLETLQVSHMERAHRSLVLHDLGNKPIYARRDVQISAGPFAAGLGIAVGGIAFNLVCPGGAIPVGGMLAFWIWVVMLPLLLFIVGTVVAIYGWMNRG